MAVYANHLDFDFEKGEIVEPEQYDMVDFMARIPGEWGTATLTSWAKVPRGDFVTHLIKPTKVDYVFPANFITKTRRPWNGAPPPYIHESL